MNEQEIRKHTNARFFERGQALQKRRAIYNMEIDHLGDGRAEVSAQVLGSSGKEYYVELFIDRDQLVFSCCNCPAAAEYQDMCKHSVAVALEYIKREQQAPHLFSPQIQRQSATSPVLKDLMYQHSMDRQARFLQEEVTGQVEIEPTLRRKYQFWEVEFKLGSSRKYVLKDVYAFAEAMNQREKVQYGKQLAFIHEESAFTKESAKMARFIMECTAAREENVLRSSGYSYYSAPALKSRILLLTHEETVRFLDLAENIPCTVEGVKKTGRDKVKSSGTEQLEIRHEDPPLRVELVYVDEKTWKEKRKKQQKKYGNVPSYYWDEPEEYPGHYLKSEPFLPICGKNRMYIFKGATAYRCSEGFQENMRLFCTSVGRADDESFFLDESDMSVFCTSLYPQLAEYTDFHTEVELSRFMPETCQIHMYLDKEEERITCRLESIYGEKRHDLTQELYTTDLYRNLEEEGRACQTAQAYFPQMDPQGLLFFEAEQDDLLYQLISTGIAQLSQVGEVYVSDNLRQISIKRAPSAGVSVELKGGLLDLQILPGQMPFDELEELLASYRLRKKYHRLKDGNFLMLEDSALEAISELTEGLELSKNDLKTGHIQVPKYRSFYVDQVLKENSSLDVERSSAYKELVRSIKSVEDSDFSVPASLKGILRRYQKDGFRWFMTLEALGFGGILADDMGLGKSLQLLSFLYAKKQETGGKPSLIVCPASLVYNWEDEVAKFVPDMKLQIIAGSISERTEKLETWESQDLLITSYDLLKRDVEQYEGKQFFCQVLDEAQNIKNHTTKAAKAVKEIDAQVKFALTGTPIENRLSELWSIFDFLMPGILGSYRSFRSKYEVPIVQKQDELTARRLRRMVNPFLMRRLKKDVLKELPDKSETVVYAKLEGEQKEVYRANAQKLLEMIKGSSPDSGSEKIKILAGLTRLRQLCCDPHLLYENYEGEAAKLDTCMELVRTAVSGGHKILLFSQFTSMLAIIEKALEKEHIACHVLTGATSKERRAELVKAFNQDDVPIFLISLKAGGTGLNLTAASIVIHFDPWWNLAAQNQATDRAHRIGQEKEVNVYKLIAQGTIEEKILKLQETKEELSQKIITEESMAISALSREDFMELLK
ncbi:MAG: DEAD/DEAH box helicase family protein [Firmicutes bacterium]|nr:DEAD/DEAH box helicase family protein [Bacillota bacterium]